MVLWTVSVYYNNLVQGVTTAVGSIDNSHFGLTPCVTGPDSSAQIRSLDFLRDGLPLWPNASKDWRSWHMFFLHLLLLEPQRMTPSMGSVGGSHCSLPGDVHCSIPAAAPQWWGCSGSLKLGSESHKCKNDRRHAIPAATCCCCNGVVLQPNHSYP